ncbi:transposase (plasmid) [Streptomyces sp. NBC_01136]|nr:transposase [Streptomyces sp. NBC_01136]
MFVRERHAAIDARRRSAPSRSPGCRSTSATRTASGNEAQTKPPIESVNARIRRAVKARGHFPNEQAAMKCIYMAIMSIDPTGKGQARWTSRWKTALNAFDITFDGRLSAARQ